MSNTGKGSRPQETCAPKMATPETVSEKIGSDICRLESAVHVAEEIRAILVGDRYATDAGELRKANEVNIYDGLSRERELIILLLDNLEVIKGLL